MRAETSPASVFHVMKMACDRLILHKEPARLVMKRLAPVQSAVNEEDPYGSLRQHREDPRRKRPAR